MVSNSLVACGLEQRMLQGISALKVSWIRDDTQHVAASPCGNDPAWQLSHDRSAQMHMHALVAEPSLNPLQSWSRTHRYSELACCVFGPREVACALGRETLSGSPLLTSETPTHSSNLQRRRPSCSCTTGHREHPRADIQRLVSSCALIGLLVLTASCNADPS